MNESKRSVLATVKEAIRDVREILKEVKEMESIAGERTIEGLSRSYTQSSLPSLIGIIVGGITLLVLMVGPIAPVGFLASIVLSAVMTAVGVSLGHVGRRLFIQREKSPHDRLLQAVYTLQEINAALGDQIDQDTQAELRDTLATAFAIYRAEIIKASGLSVNIIEDNRLRFINDSAATPKLDHGTTNLLEAGDENDSTTNEPQDAT